MEPVVQADYTQSRVEKVEKKGLTPAAYQVTRELLRTKAKRSSIILHSLPRMDELLPDVDADPTPALLGGGIQRRRPQDVAAVAHPRRGRVGRADMQTNLRGRDLISLQEWTNEEIDTILDVAAR